MCRIAGILSDHSQPENLYRQVKAMCDSLRHGGPDDEGVFLDEEGKICLGNRRLAIQDLSASGHQPMPTADNKIHITFNGEVYNFRQLRVELAALNIQFHSDTDTEVVLKAYQQWGSESFKRLKGMFAFAITDLRQQKTYLVRDPGGIKPLYYSQQGKDLIFASEVKAFAVCQYNFPENADWKVYLLALGHIPEPYTTFKNIHSLPKGHYLCWNHQTSSANIQSFYSFRYSEQITDKEEAILKVQHAIDHSVKRHLISDASIAVFLSGGIDSSILALVADSYLKERLNTLSIDLEETDYSELKYQKLVSNLTSGEHRQVQINYKSFESNFSSVIRAMDQPSTDGINSWFISKCAKENGMKAVISGIGADELFGGYPSFQRTKTIHALKKLPKRFLRLAENHPDPKYRRFYYLSYENPLGEYLFSRGFFTPNTIARVLDAEHKEIDQLLGNFPGDAHFNTLSGGNRASWLETNLYMQNQLLKDTDYMSMSHGVEVRVPFLDRDLVELALSIHPDLKYSRTQIKPLLIKAFENLLPRQVWDRPKMGFSFPFQEWMKKYKSMSEPSLYKNKVSRKLMEDFGNDKLHWSSAFALYHID
ncbi:asparagine synthase (glutamine-hydrolyzing) [Daejeonella oryzae]|uniref:asparagine synthase (glutamine-hydrolyzing) n=1 Tax=Daejeonella oryzae TaxID=1122943 RepID=UPI00042095A3|nr:asparagine synthase (glutamine-hydrolyzing) [Daejeonella oryzae]